MALVTFTAGQVLTALELNDSFAAVNLFKALNTNTVATSQTTSSTSFTDLATVGPTVTVTTGTDALVIITATIAASSLTRMASMGFAVSGATTTAASDATALRGSTNENLDPYSMSAIFRVTLTAGSNVFTAKYRNSSAANATFANRTLMVITL
jgi:hypothetical protein